MNTVTPVYTIERERNYDCSDDDTRWTTTNQSPKPLQ